MPGCRSPQRNIAHPLPEPVRDPAWVDPTSVLVDVAGTALADEATPVVLSGPPTATELPEPASRVAAEVVTKHLEALGLSIDLPGPVSETAAGAGLSETWLFERSIGGSAYALSVQVSRRERTSAVQLAHAATEIGAETFVEQGEQGDLIWVVKLADGPIQQVWAARSRGQASLVAICSAPPAYLTIALSACKTVRFDSGRN